MAPRRPLGLRAAIRAGTDTEPSLSAIRATVSDSASSSRARTLRTSSSLSTTNSGTPDRRISQARQSRADNLPAGCAQSRRSVASLALLGRYGLRLGDVGVSVPASVNIAGRKLL